MAVPTSAAPTPTAPPTESADPTADALLAAALVVVAQHGLRGATTRRMAEQAGVNEVTLFRKYGSKAELLRAALLRQAEALGQSAVHYSGDLEHDLTELCRQYAQTLKQIGPVIGVLVTELPRHPELMTVLDGPRELFGRLAALLGRYQQEGQLQAEPLGTLIPALLGPLVMPYLVPIAADLMRGENLELDPQAHVERFLHGRRSVKGDNP